MPRDRTTVGVHGQEATLRARSAAEQAKVTAAVAIVQHGKYYLGVSRRGKGNDFGFPGGGREPGETPEQCCLRELREETGLVGRIVRHVYTGPAGKKDICAAFEVSVADYSIRPAKGETGVVEWVVSAIVRGGTFGSFNANALDALAALSAPPVPAIPTCFNRMVDAYIERAADTRPYGRLDDKYLSPAWVEKGLLEIPCRPVLRLIKPRTWHDWEVDKTELGGCGAPAGEPCRSVDHRLHFEEECNLASAIAAARSGAYVSTRMLTSEKSCPSCGHDRDMHEKPYGSSYNCCKHHGGCECHLAERYGVGEKPEPARMSDEERRRINQDRADEERVKARWGEVARERRARFEPDDRYQNG